MAHGGLGARLMRRMENARAELSAALGRPVEFSGMQSVSPRLEPFVLVSALRMIRFARPDVVVEAVHVPAAATAIAEHAIECGASVLTVSPALVGTEGPRLRRLAAAHGVGLYTDGALGFGMSLRRLLEALPPGETIRQVVGCLRHEEEVRTRPLHGAHGLTVESIAHRSAGLASTLFLGSTTTAEVTVVPVRCRGGSRRTVVPGACAVSECERVGERVSARLRTGLVPSMVTAAVRPFGWWPGWSSGLLVETGPAGSLLFPRSGSDTDRTVRTALDDLRAALRARHSVTGAAERRRPPRAPVHLIHGEAGQPGLGKALLSGLTAYGVPVRAVRCDRRTHEVRAVAGPVPEARLRTALDDLRTDRAWRVRAVPVPMTAAGDHDELGSLLS
ncbi:hypothetical protein [Streptomyces sp. NPDC005009]